ncbi:MAG: cation diffusion facilitator family transporter [Candidatus Omnitrophica bacterium]|nr:cation diffusion facilitator family transporter [Candidatus Omnitrophota bacterium]
MSKEKISQRLLNPRTCLQIGLFTNIALTIFKFFAGIVGLSRAMVADAMHSFSDILTTGIAYIGICVGERPADEDHPYGHGNAETIAASLVSLIIFIIGIWVGILAMLAVIRGEFRTPLNIALLAAVVSIVVKEALFRYTIKVGRISNSPAVVADAWHHRSDAYSSVAALIGIGGARISFLYLDPVAGLVVSGFIVKIALKLIRSNIGIIMDERPHSAFINRIKALARKTEGVKKIDSIKVHRRGSKFTVDLEVAVDSGITVDEGHRIASNVRTKLLEGMQNIGDVMVHVNPYNQGG